jgi:hypothetical protein
MVRVTHTTAHIATALHGCPALCMHISLQGFACLATCSKSLHDDVTAILCAELLRYLDVAVHTAHSTKQQHQSIGRLSEDAPVLWKAVLYHYQAVAWLAALLLRTAAASAADITERLLNLPEMPCLVCVKPLVSAGVRITHAQLLAAADSMVAGAELWVQAQQQLGVETDIPPAAVAICCRGGCCGGDWVRAVRGSGQVHVTCCELHLV